MLDHVTAKPFQSDFAPDDARVIDAAIARATLDDAKGRRAHARGRLLIEGIRASSTTMGGVEDFLRDYGLSTREGLALMVLAEALLRVPDNVTQDRLIEDKLRQGGWSDHEGHSDTMFVAASAWALGMSAKVLKPGETPETVVGGLIKRMGMPTVRIATRQAMRFLGGHFVLGETIEAALKKARDNHKLGYRHSFDMLGEGARTWDDAKAYWQSYAKAIDSIGKASRGMELPFADGISVKLSALHPRYDPRNRAAVMDELVPCVLELAQKAKSFGINFTVDAEEADRLELSLDVIEAVFGDASLAGWDGFGLAVQAYQKRAIDVLDYVHDLCLRHDGKMMVRLVKGAYWDTEIKRAQERGISGFPVFTRKPATDVNYLACARAMLDMRPRIFPQFATHNALTVSTIIEMADGTDGYEFQRLHGMGEALFRQVSETGPKNKRAIGAAVPCRIYAPVGGYRDLLAYLVRRLLENGANSSFVAQVSDNKVPIDTLLVSAAERLADGQGYAHGGIKLPGDLFAPRTNSKGVEFGDRKALDGMIAGVKAASQSLDVKVQSIRPEVIDALMGRAQHGHAKWSATPVEARAVALEKAADAMEANRDRLLAYLALEAGKTYDDGIAEIREAVDFCRYYAGRARLQFAVPDAMPGPSGEDNTLGYRGRGVFGCISPWNFPLAIFIGQVSAALVAGNAVIAKPAEQTPAIAREAIKLLHEAGVPTDALIFAPGAGDVGAALVAHREIAGIAFTGSTHTARLINRSLAAKDGPIVPLIAETGGLNAMIVDATALPEQVADDVVMSAFRSAGQRCSALRVMYVQDSVADRMLAMIEGAARALKVGDPLDIANDIGPIIDKDQKKKLTDHIAAIGEKATIRYAGDAPHDGNFFAPHIVELKRADDLQEEVFGPVLHVVRWKADQLETVLDGINASGFGLTFGVHSRIGERVEHICRRIHAGNFYVNRNMIGAIVGSQPFGGSGLSGTGPKAGGPNYLTRFADEYVISDNVAAAGGNASLIAMGDG